MYQPPIKVKATPEIKSIVSATFPDYRGRTFRVSDNPPKKLDSWWDGGSRDYYAFYDIATGRSLQVHSNHPMFEKDQPSQLSELPDGVLLVRHSIFCGKNTGITIFYNADSVPKMLTQ